VADASPSGGGSKEGATGMGVGLRLPIWPGGHAIVGGQGHLTPRPRGVNRHSHRKWFNFFSTGTGAGRRSVKPVGGRPALPSLAGTQRTLDPGRQRRGNRTSAEGQRTRGDLTVRANLSNRKGKEAFGGLNLPKRSGSWTFASQEETK